MTGRRLGTAQTLAVAGLSAILPDFLRRRRDGRRRHDRNARSGDREGFRAPAEGVRIDDADGPATNRSSMRTQAMRRPLPLHGPVASQVSGRILSTCDDRQSCGRLRSLRLPANARGTSNRHLRSRGSAGSARRVTVDLCVSRGLQRAARPSSEGTVRRRRLRRSRSQRLEPDHRRAHQCRSRPGRPPDATPTATAPSRRSMR